MSSIAFVVTTSPTQNLTVTALNFIRAAIKEKIDIKGVFFYQAGVLNASSYLSIATDEYPIQKAWQALHNEQQVPLYLCATAAEKQGLLDALSLELKDHNLSSNIAPEFTVSGLAELVTLTLSADRVVQL